MSDSILDKKWMTLAKAPVEDILQTVADLDAQSHCVIHIGTDAQKHGKYMDYATAISVLKPGHGGRAFICKTRKPRIDSLQHKLFTEVGLSWEIAVHLCERLGGEQIHVHVDANTNIKWDSAKYHQALAGMVTGYGFKAVLKPDAWCASHVADHAVNGRNNSIHQRRKDRKRDKR